jgi:hypothetical protein
MSAPRMSKFSAIPSRVEGIDSFVPVTLSRRAKYTPISGSPGSAVGNGFLMFPVGGYGYVVRNPEGDTPLFQRLMDCDPRVFSFRCSVGISPMKTFRFKNGYFV